QRGLHLRGGGELEHLGDVPGLAGPALHVRAGLVQRDDRDEEQRDVPAAGPLPVATVPATLAAVEHALGDRVVDDTQAPDDQHAHPPSVRGQDHRLCRGRAAACAFVTASVTIRLSAGGKLLAFPGRMRLAEKMRIERWQPGDTATAMACYEVYLAAQAAD